MWLNEFKTANEYYQNSEHRNPLRNVNLNLIIKLSWTFYEILKRNRISQSSYNSGFNSTKNFANKMKIFHITSCSSLCIWCVHDNYIKTENVQLVYQLAFLLLFRTLSLIFCCTLKSFFFYSFWSDYESFFYCGFHNAVLLLRTHSIQRTEKFEHRKIIFF